MYTRFTQMAGLRPSDTSLGFLMIWTRLIAVLLICIFSTAAGSVAEAENNLAYKAENGETITGLNGGENEVRILTSQRVTVLSIGPDGAVSRQETAGNPYNVSVLCDTPSGLFGLTSQGEGYLYDGGAWDKADFTSDAPAPAEDNLTVFSAAALGERVYAAAYSTAADSCQCLCFDLNAGTLAVLPGIYPMNIAAYGRDQLVYTAANEIGSTGLYTYESGTGLSASLLTGSMPEDISAMAYDTQSDTIYMATNHEILASTAGKPPEEILPLKYISGIVPLGGEKLAVWSGDSVYFCGINSAPSARSLTVMQVSSRFDTAFTATTGIALRSFDAPGMSMMEHLSYALASRDGTVDIYGFLTREGLDTVKKKAMFTDLAQSAVLAQSARSLYPVLYESVRKDGQLSAWPMDVQPVLHDEEKGILARYGLPSPETFDQLMDLIPKLTEDNILNENGLRPFDIIPCSKEGLLKYFISQYMFARQKDGEQLTFDTALFRQMAGRILSEAPDTDPAVSETGEESPLFVLAMVNDRISEDMRPPFRLDENDQAIETLVYVAVVNPLSPRREEAIRYLEFISGQRDEKSYLYYADMLDPWPSRRTQDELYRLRQALIREESRLVPAEEEKARRDTIAQLQANIGALDAQKYDVTPAAIEHYHHLADRFVISQDSLLANNEGINTLISQLLAGRYDLAGFIEAMDAKVRQIYAENGL